MFSGVIKKIEIIVINDGSTDNTLKIVESYNIVRVFNTSNCGVSAARNLGINVATGSYIWFVDADDTLCDFNGKEFLNKLKNDNTDLYLFGFIKTYNLKNNNKKSIIVKNKVENKYNKAEFTNDFTSIFSENEFNVPWNKIYKKSIINRYNISFINKMQSGEDAAFNCDYFVNCNSLTVYPYTLVKYNIRALRDRKYNNNYYNDCQIMLSKMSMMTSRLGLSKSFLSNKYVEINKGIVDNLFLKYPNKNCNTHILFNDVDKEIIKGKVNFFQLSRKNKIKQIVFTTKFNIYLRFLLLKISRSIK